MEEHIEKKGTIIDTKAGEESLASDKAVLQLKHMKKNARSRVLIK